MQTSQLFVLSLTPCSGLLVWHSLLYFSASNSQIFLKAWPCHFNLLQCVSSLLCYVCFQSALTYEVQFVVWCSYWVCHLFFFTLFNFVSTSKWLADKRLTKIASFMSVGIVNPDKAYECFECHLISLLRWSWYAYHLWYITFIFASVPNNFPLLFSDVYWLLTKWCDS